jgi:hypothetical protein
MQSDGKPSKGSLDWKDTCFEATIKNEFMLKAPGGLPVVDTCDQQKGVEFSKTIGYCDCRSTYSCVIVADDRRAGRNVPKRIRQSILSIEVGEG